jgi:hypothetical protein
MFPLGAILGVFTLITLSKPSVKMLFDLKIAAIPLATVSATPPPIG